METFLCNRGFKRSVPSALHGLLKSKLRAFFICYCHNQRQLNCDFKLIHGMTLPLFRYLNIKSLFMNKSIISAVYLCIGKF